MTIEPGTRASARALWYVAPGRAESRIEPLAPPAGGEVAVRTAFTAISRGTESLVYAGAVPAAEHARMRAPHQVGAFPFPVKYGYAAVGTVVSGPPALRGHTVFALAPHQTALVLPESAVHLVPGGVPARRALLAANMETALNALWDGGALPGARIAVVGAGVVGALTAWLAGRLPGAEVTLIDVRPGRAALAGALGLRFALPDGAPRDCDLVFHASASDAGLATALAACGDEACVVEMSWYGDRPVSAPLGEAFHGGRLRLVGSQVGRVAPAMRARWSLRRRLEKALALLADPCLDALLEPDIAFDRLPDALDAVLGPGADVLCQVVAYP
jgi:threonine dehydrogenase-like Zn-dependent dehydrogenase